MWIQEWTIKNPFQFPRWLEVHGMSVTVGQRLSFGALFPKRSAGRLVSSNLNLKTRNLRCRCSVEPKTTDEKGIDTPEKSVVQEADGAVQQEGNVAEQEVELPYAVVFGLSTAGLLETAYLTAVKLLDTPLACPTSGCETVLESGYSSLFGVPLSLLGMLGYGAVALLSGQGAFGDRQGGNGKLKELVLVGGVVLATCSAYLMYILFGKMGGESCAWCLTSAGISFSIFALVARSFTWGSRSDQFPSALMPSSGAAFATVLALYLGFQNVETSKAQEIDLPYVLPEVTTESSLDAISLARRLADAGVRMYGAFWCNHCYDQKQAFGKEAMEFFPYVECYPEGYRKGVSVAKVCQDADVKNFPTWRFGEFVVEGDQDLEVLEEALQEYKGLSTGN